MAEEDAQISQTVKYFVGLAAVGKTLTEAQKKEVNDKASSKLMKECCSPAAAHVAESQAFPKVAGRVKKITLDRYINEFLPEVAITLIYNDLIKKDRRAPRPDATDGRVAPILKDIRSQIAAKHNIKTKGAAVDSVTKRLTDTSGYTGSHKERFDASGKGKGIEGRAEMASNSGYVGGYKNEGTYDGAKK